MAASNGSSSSSKQKNNPNWRDAAAGAGAGAFSKTLTAPIERIKLLIQLQHSVEGTTRVPQGAWQVARTIYINEGLLSFWRGNLPSVMRVSGTAAINFTMMNYYKAAAQLAIGCRFCYTFVWLFTTI
ncbi:ADP/ATP translocase [Seminavis robusta]|uniref:ADP/ATP translocase n=1 Tax=Seminavis robusta TaxID=568900 RepID=A0A9N8DKZ5_9STRA|nr:ADP/ATP translocase [Seminavis robusta]|eukprot:Sro202_g085270.1 ADP/ATP translocase (127) ;mRNA; r:3517-3897